MVFVGKSMVFVGKSMVFVGKSMVFVGKTMVFVGKRADPQRSPSERKENTGLVPTTTTTRCEIASTSTAPWPRGRGTSLVFKTVSGMIEQKTR